MKTTDEQNEFIKALAGLIETESVAFRDVSEEHPYGSGPAKALGYALELCRGFGMRTVNRGGKVGFAEIGEGDELVAVLGHLDVVPADGSWDYPPFALTEADGRLYGRGMTDDKGPLMACIFAMKDILEQGRPLKRRVRIIFGQTEETGDWRDLEYYCANEELPVFGFTPDADFPATYGEKGICRYDLTMKLADSGIASADGGSAANIVPDTCVVILEDGRSFVGYGKSAHASLPYDGINAISDVMEQLEKARAVSPFAEFYQKHIGKCLYGEHIPCAMSDAESGALTMNAGMLKSDGESLRLTLDVRYPVTADVCVIDRLISSAAAPFGIKTERSYTSPPIYTDKNGRVIRTLLSVYRNATGDNSEPAVIGGGTYARSMPNIVAFGPMLPGREVTEHQKNEYMAKDDLFLLREIYREAISALADL